MNKTKEELIKQAINKVQTSGITNLTIRTLGEIIDIKSSSVMYHFKSKNVLILEILKFYSENFFESLLNINENDSDPIVRINKLIDLYEKTLREDKLCLCTILASNNNDLDIDTKLLVRDFFDYIDKWLVKNLKLSNKNELISKVILSSLNGSMLIDSKDNRDFLNSIRVILN